MTVHLALKLPVERVGGEAVAPNGAQLLCAHRVW